MMKVDEQIVVVPKVDLSVEANETNQAITLLNSFEILNQDDLNFASELVKTVKDRWKELEEKRTAITKPINEGLRAINALFKPVQDPLAQAELIIKSKIANFTLMQRAAQERAMQAAAAAAQAGNTQRAMLQLAATVPVETPKGVTVKDHWDFEVYDESQIPREYLSVDPDKIKKAIWYADTERTPPRPIPGIRFFKRGAVTVR